MDEEAAGPWYCFTGVQRGFMYAMHYLFESAVIELFDKLSCEQWRNLASQAECWKITRLFLHQTLKKKKGMIVTVWLGCIQGVSAHYWANGERWILFSPYQSDCGLWSRYGKSNAENSVRGYKLMQFTEFLVSFENYIY